MNTQGFTHWSAFYLVKQYNIVHNSCVTVCV